MALAAAMTVAGCSAGDEEISDSMPSGEGTASGVYVSLTLSNPSTDRTSKVSSNPTGGEDGDGTEAGQTYEDAIEDLTVFFYPSSGATDATEIAGSAYFSSTRLTLEGTNYKTNAVEVNGLNRGTTYGVLVITNTGDLRNALGTTVGDVRNYKLMRNPWTLSGTTYSRFIMGSAAGNETLTIPAENAESTNGQGTYEDPYVLDNSASVSLERLAARVDYRSNAESFTLSSATTTYSGTVTIQKAALVNHLKGSENGTYLIKRVANTVDGTVTYCGNERIEPNGTVTNYVIEPLTAAKTAVTEEDYDSAKWSSYYDNYFLSYGNGIAQNWQNIMTEGTGITVESNVEWKRVDYAVENTVGKDNQDNRFITGIVFSAKFVPTGLTGYTEGNTFFEYNGRLYATLSALMAAYESSTTNWNRSATDFEAMTWEQVRELANTLTVNGPTGYRLYLLNQTTAHTSSYSEKVSADDAAKLTWAYYMSTTFGYTESNDVPSITITDDASTNTHNLLSKYGIRTYENGICYYTYWIKHANDGDDTAKGIMEHAIVRNNIYKIQVNGVRDLGDDIPSEEDNKLSIVVAVKDWTVLSEENFEF